MNLQGNGSYLQPLLAALFVCNVNLQSSCEFGIGASDHSDSVTFTCQQNNIGVFLVLVCSNIFFTVESLIFMVFAKLSTLPFFVLFCVCERALI